MKEIDARKQARMEVSRAPVRNAGFIYEIRDKTTGGLLMSAGIFRTEEDARKQARMEISRVSVRHAGFIYEIRDRATRGLLMSAGIFRTEEDAKEQARMDAAIYNIKGCFIRTAPAFGRDL